ncbi:hypothetical protein BDQ17DRAFT_1182634, partial [Cyathus striatus]
WVIDKYHNLLFWVPVYHRESLCDDRIIKILGKKMVKLDLSKFKHGTNWVKCY